MQVRLIGGQYDGTSFTLGREYEEQPPEFLHVWRCRNCAETHHADPELIDAIEKEAGDTGWKDDGVLYAFLRMAESTAPIAFYIMAGIDTGPWGEEQRADSQPGQRDRELVPA